MVCVAGEGQGALEIWDLVAGGDEPQKKTLKIPQSVRVAELVSRVCYLYTYKIGSVGLILQWDRNKVDLMYVRRDFTIAEIGVDFTSGTTYRLLITEWPSSPSESDEQKMPCVDGGDSWGFLEVLDLAESDLSQYLAIGPATTVNGLFRLIEQNHKPGTFGLFLRCGRNKFKLNDKDTRKLTEVGVDLSALGTVMLLVTDPSHSPATTPTPAEERRSKMDEEYEGVISRNHDKEFEDQFAIDSCRIKKWTRNKSSYKRDGCDDVPAKNESERIEEQGQEDVESNRRSENAYVGLVNQAMTCYLNSLLQALYMTPEFRNALYNWEYVKGSEKDEANSIPYQLQKLFLNLQTSSKNAIETTSLTKSFGWDSTEAWQQHDIQELCRVMFDALEQKFKNTEQADLINRLYEGKMIDYVKCLECGTEKSREDMFLDIPLPVKPFGSNVAYNSVEEALNAFVQPETLDGTNQYHCDTCNKKCDAHKGLKFTKFPYLLTLHLKRFDFDYNTFHRIKLNDEVTFPDVLNLNSFIPSTESQESPCNEEDAGVGVKCEEGSTTDSVPLDDKCQPCDNGMSVSDHSANHDHDDDSGIDLSNGPSTSSCSTHNHDNEKNRDNRAAPKGPYEYELFSIMIHSGSASGGHYYAYIKDFRTGEWLCFNDQNVSPITYDDIQKTYGGGPTRAYYSGVYSSSTNAYMLMYRQIDSVRNALPMQVKDFPKHLQELLLKMQDNQDMTYREYLMQMYRLKVYCLRPNEKTMTYARLCCRHDETWAEVTGRAYQSLCLNTVVPRDQVRLVTYQDHPGMIECSYEGREEETLRSILDDRREVLMEIREKNEKFKTYLPGGVSSKVLVVDVAKKEVVKGPIDVRGLVTQTVSDYKIQLGEIIDMEPKDIHLIVQYPNNPNARLITQNDIQLLDEGFGSGEKIFVPTSFDTSTPKSIEDGLYEIIEIFGGLISLNVDLPDTSEEVLRELNIPSLEEKTKEKAVETPLTNGPSKVSPVTDGPTDPEKLEKSEKPEANDTATTKTSGTEEFPTLWNETTSPPSIQTESEDWHTPEQSNSEDSSLSYSDRTLVGEGDASEDDDYPLTNHVEHELFQQTEQENWDIEDPSEFYFRATPHPDKVLRVLVDKRMSLGTLKKLLEPYVGVPMEYFKIFRQSDGEMECSRLTVTLNFHKDGEILYLKLGRALRSGEFKVKLHQLLLDWEAEPYRFLCEWIVSKDATVGQTKKEILVELKRKFFIDIPFERCRLRRKNYKVAAKVFLDDQKFKDLNLCWPYEIIVQELPGKEPVTDPNDVVIFARRMPTPVVRLGPIQELVVSGKSIAEVRQKLSELSGIPEENLEMAKGKSSLPGDLMLLLLQNVLDWNRQSTTPENCPEITLEDGIVIYYRDWREKVHVLSAEEIPDIKSKTKSRMLGISSSSRYSPRRERALKIYIDDK